MARLRLTVAYVGTAYHGWQTQLRKDKYLPTIQSLLEGVVRRITGEAIHVHGAGRTDSGVHAHAQVAHVDVPDHLAPIDWQLAFNTALPTDVRIMDARIVHDTFHAQFDAVRKTYEYRLWLSRRCTPPRLAPYVWACGPLNIAPMDEAAVHMCGTHDFASLQNRGGDRKTTVRTLERISRLPEGLVPTSDAGLELVWEFQASGFLKQMVRNLMGLLVAVGRGKLEPEGVLTILEACDRRHTGMTAPAHGLTLKNIEYQDLPVETSCKG